MKYSVLFAVWVTVLFAGFGSFAGDFEDLDKMGPRDVIRIEWDGQLKRISGPLESYEQEVSLVFEVCRGRPWGGSCSKIWNSPPTILVKPFWTELSGSELKDVVGVMGVQRRTESLYLSFKLGEQGRRNGIALSKLMDGEIHYLTLPLHDVIALKPTDGIYETWAVVKVQYLKKN